MSVISSLAVNDREHRVRQCTGLRPLRRPRRFPVGYAISVLRLILLLTVFAPMLGCLGDRQTIGSVDLVWGKRGTDPGELQKPRAIAIDEQQRLYLVDMTARIQVFDLDGNFLHGWQTPVHTNGRPTGLSFDRQGRLLVADTHYYQVLIYTTDGELLGKIGGTRGEKLGEFGFVTDIAEDSRGNLYISEYGEFDRIQKVAPDGTFVLQIGGHGTEPGKFIRPQSVAVDDQDRLWVTDSGNHRLQVFDTEGTLLFYWGESGHEAGQLYYPYSLVLDGQGHVYVCEYGNHRVQKFTLDGKSLGCWGREGRKEGETYNPWGIVQDSQGRIHVLDTNNHRVQRIRL